MHHEQRKNLFIRACVEWIKPFAKEVHIEYILYKLLKYTKYDIWCHMVFYVTMVTF